MTKNRILVIRGGAIGDFILTLPVFAALREQFPTTHLSVLGYPHIAQLALAGGLVDELRSIEARPLAGFFARHGTLDADLAEYFSSFAIILSYLYDPDAIFETNVLAVSNAHFLAGPHRPNEQLPLHATETFLKPLERLAIFAPDPLPRLNVKTPVNSAQQVVPWLALHPGSGSATKNWPASNWCALVDELMANTRLNILLVSGEAEERRVRDLAGRLPVGRCLLAQDLALSELALRLQSCVGFVGHDSGITHLASALGLPCLVLWGPSKEEIWRPRHPAVRVLNHPAGLAGLEVKRVRDEIIQIWG